MAVEEYEYNGRIWRPHPTRTGADSFYHAVFGEGQLSVDKEASFKRKCLLNFLSYMKGKEKPENFERFLANILDDEDLEDVFEAYLQSISASEYALSVKEIPLISALQKVRVVVFLEDSENPTIFHPEEDLLGNYPWKTKCELREAVVHFNGSDFTRLQFVRYDEVSNDPDSVLEESARVEAEEDNTFYTETYPKLTGSAGIRGILYQIDVSTIFLLNGTSKLDSFRLSTENEKTGKFDDVDLEIPPKKSFFLQAKHKQTKTIYQNDLFQTSSDADFGLPKYYFSYQDFRNNFDVETLYLCTNTNVSFPKECSYFSKHLIEDDDLLYISDMENSYYKFNKDIVVQFRNVAVEYKEKNMPDKVFAANVLSDSRIEDFLSKFRLVAKYPVKGGTDTAIENLLCQNKYCNPLQTRNCAKYLNDKMLEWYDNKKGRYLNQRTLRIFLSEFRSNNFCEKMYNLDIHLEGEHLNYCREKRLVHIEFRGSYILNMVKVYYGLYINKKKYLFISPMKGKDEEEEAQLEMVRAFKDSFHEVLVACFEVSGVRIPDVATMLTDILKTSTYKRVILIAGKNDPLVRLLRDENENEYEEVFESITFNNLTLDSQSRLLKRVTHIFDKSI